MLRVVCSGLQGRVRNRDQRVWQGILLGYRGYIGLSHLATKIRQGKRERKKRKETVTLCDICWGEEFLKIHQLVYF